MISQKITYEMRDIMNNFLRTFLLSIYYKEYVTLQLSFTLTILGSFVSAACTSGYSIWEVIWASEDWGFIAAPRTLMMASSQD